MAAVPAFRAPSSDEESSASPAQSIFVTMISPGGPVNLGASTSGTSGKGPRVHWSEAETWSLIRLWEDNIGELRRQRRNAGVYETIRLGLERLSIDKTRKQVSDKIDNLNQTYRTKKKNQTTGSGKVTWPYFYDLHRFLGGLPVNDPSLVDDSLPGDALQEPEDISPEESQETVDPPEELAVEPQQKKKKSLPANRQTSSCWSSRSRGRRDKNFEKRGKELTGTGSASLRSCRNRMTCSESFSSS
ncbi:myb/SANT-like DNA-binding domain-containing protein 1 [Ixodes scapularis]|uniref:myb/SANT-like DNA-binding domain-containing protein 1 n=1 Tax=Ixodes scapularis TaxID=6945 RepID=UPI001C387B8A|nr:myb/SANT-like DNA-binding domain-containing protein 1 [Ixodes scapularis]